MLPYTIDVLVLLAVSIGTAAFGAWWWYVDRVLGDPDHPDHDDAKAALSQPEYDRWRFL